MKPILSLACVILLVSCGRKSDPAFVSRSGDLEAFLTEVIPNPISPPDMSNRQAGLQTTWHFRVITGRHESGEYLNGGRKMQVATAPTNFAGLESFFTKRLGPPSFPLREEASGWRHMGWGRPELGVAVWLLEHEDLCRIELTTEAANGKNR